MDVVASPMAPVSAPRRTFVTLPRTLAGILETLPALGALAAGGRSLVLLALPQHHALLRLLPGVEAILGVSPSEGPLVAALRALDCAEAVHLDDSTDGPWLALRGRIARRWGYRGGVRGLLLAPGLPPPDPAVGTRRLAALLEALEAPLPADWTPRLDLPPALGQRGVELLARARVAEQGGPLIALAPTTDLPGAPVWPWPRFVDLVRALRRDDPRRRVVLLATAEELWPVVRVHEETARFYPALGPDLDLAELAAVIAALDLVVSAESSWLPLAAALGVATVALVDPRRTSPTWPLGIRHGLVPGRRRWPWWRPRLDGIEVAEVVRVCAETVDLAAGGGEG